MNKAEIPTIDSSVLAAQLEALPALADLRTSQPAYAEATPDVVAAILETAAQWAKDYLDPLNATEGFDPPCIVDGRVEVNALHHRAWAAFTEAGWLGLDLPIDAGGQGLPLAVGVAVQEIMDRHCPAFGMVSVPVRSAVRLIDAYGDWEQKARWLPLLVEGRVAATICISEAGAGSDVMRMRTKAVRRDDGSWSVTGEKQWISFGSHDLTDGILHCLLARTAGTKGLSLFLVPDQIGGKANGVFVRRLEEKLGLHLSPTCAMGFEDAAATLLGEEGRGLQQMFVMIANMRLSVGAMGLGIASGVADIALNYARERRQGGAGPEPCPIIEHPDVQRQLLDIHAETEMLRGLLYQVAVEADLSRDAQLADATDRQKLVQWLLPILKTLGGETAFDCASAALQVLGGAGYTCDWPVEQALRDARVLPVFEGTTGIQAIDLLRRRLWSDQGAGLAIFLAKARAEVARLRAGNHLAEAEEADDVLDLLDRTGKVMAQWADSPAEGEAGASAFLKLASIAALTWVAARLAVGHDGAPTAGRFQSLARYFLTNAPARARAAGKEAVLGAARLEAISDL